LRMISVMIGLLLLCPVLILGQVGESTPAHGEEMTYDPLIGEVIGQVNMDSLLASVRILSGEDSVWIEDARTVIPGRGDGSGNDLAAAYLSGKLESYRLEVHYDNNGGEVQNVVAIQPGLRFPEKQYIFCAHYDAVGEHGADDNASGAAAVLEAARLLSPRNLDYTVIYAFWDQEEMGYLGSAEYALEARTNQDEIRGVLNLDMIGWDGDGDRLAEIHSSDVANSDSLARVFQLTDSVYGTGLDLKVYSPGTSKSDHGSFWNEGFGAVMLIEAWYGEDYNPFYPSDGDRVEHFDTGYFHDMSKLAIGSISYLAGMIGEPSISVAGELTAYPSDTAEVWVNGENTLFTYHQESTGVWLSRGSDSIGTRQVNVLSDTSLQALFYLAPDAVAGSWDVSVFTAAHGKFTVNNGFEILPLPARLEVSPDTFGFSVDSGGTAGQFLLITNSGGSDLTFTVVTQVMEGPGTGDTWLSTEPEGGSRAPGGADEIKVLVNATMKIPGTYSGLIAISSNDSRSPMVEIPVGMEVTSSGYTGNQSGDPAKDPAGNGISVFPNPVGDVLFIESGYPGSMYVGITSTDSRSMFSRVVSGPSCRIDLASLRAGVYLVTIRSGSRETTRVIIRN
jgi:hypothetical protein